MRINASKFFFYLKLKVFQNAQVYAAQAIAKRPLTVFNCITKAHNNGIKNLNQLLQEYSSKISNTVNEASQDLANLNFDVQLIQSVIEGKTQLKLLIIEDSLF